MVRLYTEKLHISYGERLIVKNLSVNIPDKKITTIIGSNGCGKSTLLKAIYPHYFPSIWLRHFRWRKHFNRTYKITR